MGVFKSPQEYFEFLLGVEKNKSPGPTPMQQQQQQQALAPAPPPRPCAPKKPTPKG